MCHDAVGHAETRNAGGSLSFPTQVCGACPQRSQCVNPKSKSQGRTVFIVEAKERLIRAHLVRRQELDFIALLAQRPDVERVIAGLAQCGGKQAHRMGQDNVSFDETLSALGYNLRRLGAVLKQQPAVASRLEEAVLLFLCLLLVQPRSGLRGCDAGPQWAGVPPGPDRAGTGGSRLSLWITAPGSRKHPFCIMLLGA